MNNSEIDALPAGRELDALVAGRVLGLTVYRLRWAEYADIPIAMLPGDSRVPTTDDYLKPYSTDIAAALSLLEAGEADWQICRQNGQYGCEIIRAPLQWKAWAETAPLAICRAVLQAVPRKDKEPAKALVAPQSEATLVTSRS